LNFYKKWYNIYKLEFVEFRIDINFVSFQATKANLEKSKDAKL